MRKRVKDFDVLKHPFLSGRFLYNVEIIKDVEEEKITKEQAARYLKTSSQYIDWAIKNKHKIIDFENIDQEEINKFINNNPYLPNIENK